MGEVKMDGLAKKFLKTLQDWIDKRIPEKTRDCLRTKVAIVIKEKENNKTIDVILAGDYGTYLSLIDERNNYAKYEQLKAKQTSSGLTSDEEKQLKEVERIIKDLYKNRKMTQDLYDKEVMMLTLEDLTTIKADEYNVGDYVIIGIVDNKLTNAFVLYKSVKKGV